MVISLSGLSEARMTAVVSRKLGMPNTQDLNGDHITTTYNCHSWNGKSFQYFFGRPRRRTNCLHIAEQPSLKVTSQLSHRFAIIHSKEDTVQRESNGKLTDCRLFRSSLPVNITKSPHISECGARSCFSRKRKVLLLNS